MANRQQVTLTADEIATMREREQILTARNERLAANGQTDTGSRTNDTIVVTGNGLRGRTWAGDTVDTIARAWRVANPDDRRSFMQVRDWIIRTNNLRTINGENCEGDVSRVPNIRVGMTLRLPEGNEITNLNWVYVCPPELPPVPPVTPPPPEAPPPEQPAPQPERAPLLAQYAAERGDARDAGLGVMMFNGYYGEPPRDGRAVGPERAGRETRDGVIAPQDSEGQRTVGGDGTDGTPGRGRRVLSGRAERRELTFGPEATYIRRTRQDGSVFWEPNSRYNQKVEQNIGYRADGGQWMEAVEAGGLIRHERRLDPRYASILSNSNTARNRIDFWVGSGDAVRVRTFFMGIQDGYVTTETRFNAGNQSPEDATRDAERLLQLNVRTAMSPIMWSVTDREAGRPDYTGLRNSMSGIFSSPQFAALPAAEQQRLRTTYEPMIAQLDNPDELLRAVGGREALSRYYNPFDDMARERARDPYIRDHYWSGLGARDQDRPRGMNRDEWRSQQAELVLRSYNPDLEQAGNRVPYRTEREIGTGVAFNRPAQTVDAIRGSRREWLEGVRGNPEMLDAYITTLVDTPGAMQRVVDPLFMASRSGRGLLARVSDSRGAPILGFRGDGETDRYVENTVAQLGGERYRERVDYRGNSLANQFVNNFPLFLGIPNAGANRNQNRGIADGFPEAVRERWNHPDPAVREAARAEIRQAVGGLIDRGLIAEENGYGYTAASLVSVADPIRAERYGRYDSEAYTRLRTLGSLPLDARAQHEAVVDRTAAQIEQALERNAANGERYVRAEDGTLRAAIQSGQRDVEIPGQPRGPGDANMDAARRQARVAGVGVWDLSQAEAARNPDGSIDLSRLGVTLATANNPGRSTQEQTDRQIVRSATASDPVAASILMMETMASFPRGSDLARRAGRYLDNIDRGNMNGYADRLEGHINALRAAGSNAEARNRVITAATSDFGAYFASDQAQHGRQALRFLSDDISDDAVMSRAFNARFGNLAMSAYRGGNGLSAAQQTELSNRLVTATTPEARAQVIREYAASLRAGPNDGNAGAGAGELNAAQINASTTLLASGLPDAQLRAGLTAILAGNTDAISSINAGGTALNALNAEQRSALNALRAANPSADQLRAGLASILAGNSEAINALNAGGTIDLNAINAAGTASLNSLNAGQQQSLNALVSLNSTLSSLNANSSSLNAGQTNQLNAILTLNAGRGDGSVESLRANMNELNAGFRDQVGTFNARWSVDIWKVIQTIAIGACVAGACPGGGDTPFDLTPCPGCGGPDRPIPIPNIPGIPGAPGRPIGI